MKHATKKTLIIVLCCCLIAVFAAFVAACTPKGGQNNEHDHVDANNDGKCDVCETPMEVEPPKPAVTAKEFKLTIQRSSGDPIEGASVIAYAKSDFSELQAFGETDKNGQVTLKTANPVSNLWLRWGSAIKESNGYVAPDGYKLSAEQTEVTIKVPTAVIPSPLGNGQMYAVGDVMHDFTFTDSKGNTGSLSSVLKEKKMVLLNFWYIGCTWCIREFPDMKEAFLPYADDVEILGLNPMDKDENGKIESFRADEERWDAGGLPFRMIAQDTNNTNGNECANTLATAFALTGYPTSIVIDREGVICFIGSGSGTKNDFIDLFERYTAEPYEQYIYWPNQDVEMEKPDVKAPASSEIEAAINNTASGFTFSYYFDEDEYNWPWLVMEKDGENVIYPSNQRKNNSYSIIYTDVTLAENQVLAFDFFTSSEAGGDVLYLFIDGYLAGEISGVDDAWRTYNVYIALKAGTYTLGLSYSKNESSSDGDDAVFIKNMRLADVSDLNELTEILYPCASGTKDGNVWSNYETAVLGSDGYYHVGTEDGPLVLANLMGATRWNSRNAYTFVMNGGFKGDVGNGEEDLTDRMTQFAQYANNSDLDGYIAVTEEMQKYLVALTKQYGNGNTNSNEWLELCSFVQRFAVPQGTDPIYPDPARGTTDFNAFEATEGETIHVEKLRPKMPRGIWYQFVPSKNGVYRFRSTIGAGMETSCVIWVQNAAGDELAYDDNFNCLVYLKGGETYYLLLDLFMVDDIGSFDFTATWIAASGYFWTPASGGSYTYAPLYDEQGNPTYDENGNPVYDTSNMIVAGAIDYKLGDDDVYHYVNADGSLGSAIYITLGQTTAMFETYSIAQMSELSAYFCKNCGYKFQSSVKTFEEAVAQDPNSVSCIACGRSGASNFEKHKSFELPTPKRDADSKVISHRYTIPTDGETPIEVEVPEYEKDTDGNIIFTDYTPKIESLIEYSNTAGNYDPDFDNETILTDINALPPRYCVKASKELVDILMKFIIAGDYSLNPRVENAWLMLAFYYRPMGIK